MISAQEQAPTQHDSDNKTPNLAPCSCSSGLPAFTLALLSFLHSRPSLGHSLARDVYVFRICSPTPAFTIPDYDETRCPSAQLFAHHRTDRFPGCRGAFLARHDPLGCNFIHQIVTATVSLATCGTRLSVIHTAIQHLLTAFAWGCSWKLGRAGSGGS